MQNIQEQAIQTYQNNLSFFQKNFPDVYTKIDLLSQAIETNQYKENYSLEYKNDYFDILDVNTGHYLYGNSSIELAIKAAKEMNLKKNEGVIETFYNYNFTSKAVELANNEDPTVSEFVLTAPIVHFTTNLIDKNKSTMKQIYKFIFFGVGLGVHLREICNKLDAYMYFIVENNLEIFRLSLFVTDYSLLTKGGELYFSIMEDEDTFKNSFEKFYHNSFIRNNYIKYSLFYPEYKEKIASIQKFIVTQSNMTYQQNKLLLKNIKVLNTIKEEYKFFNISKHYKNTPFSNRPVILVAAGPSLNKEIEWLKNNAPYSIIVALFMTLPILDKYNIKPDIVIHADENLDVIDVTMDKIRNKALTKDSLFFLSPSIECSHFFPLTSKDKIYVFEDRTRYRFNKGFLEAFSVGEISYALALLWDTHEIYLLGLDLALDSKTKQTHAQGHESAENKNDLVNIQESDSVSLRGSELYIKGNFADTVPTTPLFDMSRIMVNTFTKRYKEEHQKVYNLNDGAYFIDTIAKKTDKIDLSQTNKVKDTKLTIEMEKFYNAYASDIMDNDEKLALYERVEDALHKKELILDFANKKSPSIEQFQNSFNNTAEQLITTPSNKFNELAQIYIIYLENIGGYIGDFFNTSNINNPKRNIKHFQKIIATQFLKIVDKYIEGLKEIDV